MKIKVFVNTGFAGAKHEGIIEIPDKEWAEMSEEDKEKRLDQEAFDFMGNCIEIGAYPLNEDTTDE